MALKARQTDPAQIAATYDGDFFRWTREQGRALRENRATDVDWDNVAEEIETLGRSERGEIRSRLLTILLHLLKWQFQPSQRKGGWEATIIEARDGLNEQLAESPSLRRYPGEILKKRYEIARLKAADETDLPLKSFPEECPYTVEQILDDSFMPEPDAR